jgi:O-antigen/teichoic acid export membrane protein
MIDAGPTEIILAGDEAATELILVPIMDDPPKGRARSFAARIVKSRRLSSVVQVMAARAFVLATNLATGMISAAMLGPQGRGVQAALMVGPQFAGAVSELGLHASVIYNSKDEPELESSYVGCALLLGAITGIFGMVASWLIAPYWLTQYDATTIHTARMMLTIIPVGVVMHIMMAGMESRGEFPLANRLFLLGSVLTLAALGIMAALGQLTPARAAFAYLYSAVPIAIALAWHIRRIINPVFTLRAYFTRRLLRFGIRYYGVDILGALGSYIDQLLVVLFLAPASLGIYAVAVSASRLLNVIPTSVSTVLFPSVAARSRTEVVELVGLAARVTTIIASLAAAALALLGPFLLHTFYGAKFDPAVDPFRILLIDCVIANLGRILYQSFSASGRPEIVTGIELTGLATSVASMIILVPLYGTIGAALSLLIASVVRFLCVIVGYRFFMHMALPNLILTRADINRITSR